MPPSDAEIQHVRHVHLIPERDAQLLRDWAPHEIPGHKRRDGWIERSDRLPAPAGRPACRCCGYPLKEGEPAISAAYVWPGGTPERGCKPIWLHADECRWGLAHDVEPAETWHSGQRRKRQAGLTRIERSVLELAEIGATVPQTARLVGRASRTVEALVTKLNKRFGTRSRAEAAEAARAEGLLSPTAPWTRERCSRGPGCGVDGAGRRSTIASP